MAFNPGSGGGGSGSIASSSDVNLSSPQNSQVLAYDSDTAKWQNAFSAGGSGGGVFLTVAARNAPDIVKQRADYVCDGSNDQVEINQALEDSRIESLAGSHDNMAGGTVLLSGGEFNINSPVLMPSRTTLAGSGWGTQLVPTAANTQAVIMLADGDQSHMTMVQDFTIHGRGRNAHGIHYRQNITTPGDIAAPDARHRISRLNIFRCGSADNPRDAIYLDGTGNGGPRASRIFECVIRHPYRHGINIEGASDAKIVSCLINTHEGGSGHGVVVGGGNCEISDTKVFYATMDGFHVTSSRAQLSNCAAQDAGRHGFYLSNNGGSTVSGGQADSCGRLQAGDGYYIAGNYQMISGVKSSDRMQTPGSPQRYGFNFAGGQGHFVLGSARGNSSASVNGTPGSGSYVRIATDDQGLYTRD